MDSFKALANKQCGEGFKPFAGDVKQAEESYEQKQERERVERVAKVKKMNKRFAGILKLLGCEVEKNKDIEYYSSNMSGALSGGSICLSSGGYGYSSYSQVKVSASFPRDAKGQYVECYEKVPYVRYDGSESFRNDRVECGSINISLSKSDERIAKEIKSRFFPVYEKKLKAVLVQIAKNDNYEAQCLSNISLVKSAAVMAAPSEGEVNNRSFSCYLQESEDGDDNKRLEAKVGSEKVELNFDYLSLSEAVALILAAKKILKEGGK